ncbi:T9SS type A sorting domain-containing protein [Aquimarina gracilis]|uniref:T9SS type A sorting domain-containing protein n=1 Tax=Aquimarina gracilis TaxID=874422 RepID=A0ABU6A0Y2_9FLAO|nr:T9SS type A sorting domain-containing protein [Aquimarina gracilis]MEB3347777.1 T9SS type A sorting domain-containing protein [Aquimarina gracilis]
MKILLRSSLWAKALIFSLVAVTGTNAQQDFRPRKNISTKGDVLLIGNAIHGIKGTQNDAYNILGTNNGGSFDTAYIDIDGDDTTFSSSSANLDDPSGGCAEIVYAGLYWTANYYLARQDSPNVYLDNEITAEDAYGVTDSDSNVTLNINNGALAGRYFVRNSEFDNDVSDIKLSPASSNLVVAEPIDGCLITNAAQLTGNIAVIQSGSASCTDRERVINAQNAGAIGVVIVNDNGNLHKLTGSGSTAIAIPSVSMGNNNLFGIGSENLITELLATTEVVNAILSTTGNEVETGLPINDVRKNGTADYRNIQLGFGLPGSVTYTTVQPQIGTQVIDVNGVPTTTHGGVLYDGYANTASNPASNASDNVPYTCFADVTDIVKTNGFGTYTVANMKATVGVTSGVSGAAGGWSLVVVYSSPDVASTNRFISISDGFREILGGAGATMVDLPIEGFRTLPAPNPVDVKFGVASLEGDNGIAGDNLEILNTSSFYVDIFNAANPQNNFFNSSISVDGVSTTNRNPASVNTLGFDTDFFRLENDALDLIPNDATSADFRLSTNGDTYQAFMTVFSVEDIAPELRMIKEVYDPSDLTTVINNQTVELGDDLVYRLRLENTGNENYIGNVIVEDILPANVDLVSIDGIDVNANPAGNINTIPTISYTTTGVGTGSSQTVQFTIPADLLTSGPLGTGEIAIDFTVQTIVDCNFLRDACSDEISNVATATYVGEVSGTTVSGNTSSSEIDACGNPNGEATGFFINVPACRTDVAFCGGSLQLVAGAGYDQYIWSGPNGFSATTATNFVEVSSGGTGVYSVVKNDTNPSDGTCVSLTEEFEVTNFAEFPHPLQDVAAIDNFVDYFDITNGGCNVELAKINLCGNQTYTVDSGFNASNVFNITWQELTNVNCLDRSDNCPAIVGGCDAIANWTDISTTGLTTSLEFENPGEYRMIVEFDGGCTQVYYFDINKSDYQPAVDIADMKCNNVGIVQVNNIPVSGTFRFLLKPQSDPAPTLADIGLFTNTEGRFDIPFQLNPYNFTVYAIDGALPNCIYEIDGTVLSYDPQVIINPISPECVNNDNGNGLGRIEIEVTGGLPQYEYRITGGPNNIDIVTGNGEVNSGNFTFHDIESGTYTVQVISNRDPLSECSFEEVVVIVPAPIFIADAHIIAPSTCDSGAIVEVVVNTGSGGPYQYADESGVFSANNTFTLPQNAVSTDTFTFFVSDTSTLNGCIIEAQVNGPEPYVPIEIQTVTPISPVCPSDSGSIRVQLTPSSVIADRTFTYELLDDTYSAIQTITNAIDTDITFTNVLVDNEYTIRVSHNNTTDPAGSPICPVDAGPFDITVPNGITFDAVVTRELSCIQGSEAAQVTISNFAGGTGAFEWATDATGPFTPVSGPSAVIEVATAQAGFIIYVREPNSPGCAVSRSVDISEIISIDDIIFNSGTIDCDAQTVETTFEALPVVSQGVFYEYSISPDPASNTGSTSFSNTNTYVLTRGTNYTITARRSDNLCIFEKDYFLPTVQPVQISNVRTQDIACFGSNDGFVEFSVSSTNFNYEIGNPASGFITSATSNNDYVSVDNLASGNYYIRVFDISTDCETTDNFIIDGPTAAIQIETSISQPITNEGGKIEVSATGGVPPYAYSIDGISFSQSNIFEDLAAGEYTVYVQDSSTCIVSSSIITIDPAPGLMVELDLSNAVIICFGGSEASIDATATGASGVYLYRLVGTDYLGNTISTGAQANSLFSNLAAGNYEYIVESSDNASQSIPFAITQPEQVTIEVNTTDIVCNGLDNGIVTVTSRGGTPPYSYSLFTGSGEVISAFVQDGVDGIAGEHTFEGLVPGSYRIAVEDANGCPTEQDANIFEPSVLQATTLEVFPETCNSSSDGAARFEVTGGTPPYETNITNNDADFVQNVFTYTNLPAGSTTVFIKDANNCRVNLTVDIAEAEALFFDPTITPVTSDASGSIEVDVVGGTAPYSYELRNPAGEVIVPAQTDNLLIVDIAGNYRVFVSDANGCETWLDVTVAGPQETPLTEYADEIFFCTITGQSYPVVTIEDTEGETLEIPAVAEALIVWQKLSDITCTEVEEDTCPTTDSSCSSSWFDIATGTSGTITDEGQYRIVITFVTKNGNNTIIYYFKAETNMPDLEGEFKMYPNPARGRVTLNREVKSIQVFDVMGKMVLESNENSYDISSLFNGVYFVKVITNDNEEIITKLVKK